MLFENKNENKREFQQSFKEEEHEKQERTLETLSFEKFTRLLFLILSDIGSVFGIGFPPFRGGPFRMLDTYGVQRFLDQMLRYRDELGAQFEPAAIIKVGSACAERRKYEEEEEEKNMTIKNVDY